jgi:hypothetical protein
VDEQRSDQPRIHARARQIHVDEDPLRGQVRRRLLTGAGEDREADLGIREGSDRLLDLRRLGFVAVYPAQE